MHLVKKFALTLLGALALVAASTRPADAQYKAVRLTGGLSAPLYACAAPGDTSRIFIVQQGGLIRILKNGAMLPTPFLNVGTKIVIGSEQGLLGLAFHPDYANNGYFFVSYTRSGDGANIVERYSVTANPDVADPNSGLVFLGPVSQPQSNHNGGCIQFGADGMLYVGIGDGGNGNDTGPGHPANGNGQTTNTRLGKILRIDVDIAFPHIPPTNPFVGDPNYLGDIWAIGVRNPWRFSFDRLTGDMYMADVGQSAKEEVNFEPAGLGGRNYGWKCMEGTNCSGLGGCTCNAPTLTLPIDEYTHSFGCSITGGYIYRGCAMPALQGTYFYADYCSARIWSFTYDGTTNTKGPVIERTSQLAPGGGFSINSITSFGEDGYGELLIVDGGGELYRVVSTTQVDCNSNGVEDACDLQFGNSLDVNANSVPDECECSDPTFYCTGKFNSEFCLPSMETSGYASSSRGFGFTISAVNVLNNKTGVLLYSLAGQGATPFQGGTLCVALPFKRVPGVNSGGNPPPSDCSGVFVVDFNTFLVGGLGGNPSPALLVPGTMVTAQWWGRDPGFPAPNNSQLANGVEFQMCP